MFVIHLFFCIRGCLASRFVEEHATYGFLSAADASADRRSIIVARPQRQTVFRVMTVTNDSPRGECSIHSVLPDVVALVPVP